MKFWGSKGGMKSVDQYSTQWVSLPANREELVELFGEPEKEGGYVLSD